MNLVGRVGIPDDELSILGSRNEMTLVGGPVHGVNLGEVSTEGATRAHHNTGEGGNFIGHCPHYAHEGSRTAQHKRRGYLRDVSAEDSLFARIFSFRLSASRRAAAMRSWMSPCGDWDMVLRLELQPRNGTVWMLDGVPEQGGIERAM